MLKVLGDFYTAISIVDLIYVIITILSLIKCYKNGFVLSILSMAKWLLAYIITLIIFPKVKPYLDGVIDNEYILDLSLGITIFIIVIFLVLLISKGISKAVRYTVLEAWIRFLDFLVFKSIYNIYLYILRYAYYNHDKWPLNINKSYVFPYLEKGSNYLLKEFPDEKTYQDSKKKLKNFRPKINEECGVWNKQHRGRIRAYCFRASCFTTPWSRGLWYSYF